MSIDKKYRNHLFKLHGHKYHRHYISEGYRCFYCNVDAEALDHVPALSRIDCMPYKERLKIRIPAVLLPSCHDCNKALGDRNLNLVAERLEYLELYYDKKLSKLSALWTEEEILELSPTLQYGVRQKLKLVSVYSSKIREIQRRSLLTDTWPLFDHTLEFE